MNTPNVARRKAIGDFISTVSADAHNGRYAAMAQFSKVPDFWRQLKQAVVGKSVVVREPAHSITFPNGSQIRMFNLDNRDKLRGLRFTGVLLEERLDK